MLTEKSAGSSFTGSLPCGMPPRLQIPRPRRSSLLPWPTSQGSGPSLPKPSLPSYRPHTRQPLQDSSPARVAPHHASGVSHAANPSFLLFDRCRSQSSARRLFLPFLVRRPFYQPLSPTFVYMKPESSIASEREDRLSAR